MKQSKEYNHAYNSGYYAGLEAARAAQQSDQADLVAFSSAELQHLLSYGQGYVRIGRSSNGLVWARWKWTEGSLADHYTFGSDESVPVAIAQMCTRVHECESGKRKATRDTGYKRR